MSGGTALQPLARWAGAAATLTGFVIILLAGNAASGESDPSDQLGPLVAGVAGLVLLLAGGGAVAYVQALRARQRVRHLDALLTNLHRDVRALAADSGVGPVVAVDHAETYHRRGCPVLDGKPGVSAVDDVVIAGRGLRPCTLCEPPT